MARFLKIAALTAGGIVLLLVATAGVISAGVDPNEYKDDIIRLVQQRHQRTLAIPGTIKLTLYPRIGADLGQVSLSERASRDPFALVTSARVSLALAPLLLRRQVVIDRIDVRGVTAHVTRLADGSMNTGDLTSGVASGSPAAPGTHTASQVTLAIDAIRVSNARVLFADRRTGRTLDISNLNIDSGPIARGVPSQLAMSANVRINQPALASAITLKTSFMPDRERRRIAFTDLEANLDLSLRDAKARVTGQIDVDLDQDEFAADLKGSVDASTFDAKASLRGRAYHLTLHVDKLDLGHYQKRLGPATASAQTSPLEDGGMVDLSPLASLRASGSIHVGELTMGALRASNVRAALRSDAGKLVLQPISARLYGGSSAGSLALDFSRRASTPHITLVQNLTGVQLGPLLQDVLGSSPVDAKGDIMIDLNTEGASSLQLRQALSGSASLRLTDGVLNGLDIGAMVAGGPAATGLAAAAFSTRFSRLDASFTIANGIAHNADLLAQARLFSLAGAGDFDLAREQIDYTLTCTLAGTGAALPVRLSGPWQAVSWQLDGEAISAAAVKEKARDKLKQAIRGLLKR